MSAEVAPEPRPPTAARDHEPLLRRLRNGLMRDLAAGLLVIVPTVVTLYTLLALFNFSDQLLFKFLPPDYRPDKLIGFRVPGLGILLSLLILLIVGRFTRVRAGGIVVRWFEGWIERVPVLRGIYSALRNFLMSFFAKRNTVFRRVVVIEYPRKGIYTLAFVTGELGEGPLRDALPTQEVVTVFVPTTPNPTSGFLLLLPRSELIDVPIGVDNAFRLIVSGGVLAREVTPDEVAHLGVDGWIGRRSA